MTLMVHLKHNAQYLPEKLAVSDGSLKYSWSQFNARTRNLAASLARRGVKKGDRVGVLMPNGYAYLEAYYALPRLGAIIVPLNTRYAPAEFSFALNDSEAVALLVEDTFWPVYEKCAAQLETVKLVVRQNRAGQPVPAEALDYEQFIEAGTAEADYRDAEVEEEDIVGLFYTGGTTGRSKGVMLTHKNLVSNALITTIPSGVTSETVYCHVAPMFHIADAAPIVSYTMMGACHTFLPKFEAVKTLEIIQRERVNHIGLVPTMINMLLQVPDIKDYDLSSLELIFSGGSPTPVEVLRKMRQLLPCKLRQGYGMTEASPTITVLAWEDMLKALEAGPGTPEARLLGSCGIPGLNIEVRLVDSLDQEVRVGEIGEVTVKAPNVMKGYWKLPQETALALRGGWLHTGDLAIKDEKGYFYIIDRKKDMIISGGENVYSAEVENALYAHPAILEAAVIGVPDPKWGERVHAVVVLKPGYEVSEAELIARCRELIAGYKIPKTIEFVSEMPKSGAGKILKRNLREKFWQSGPVQVS